MMMMMVCLTLWVQQPGDPQVSLGHAEGLLEVLLVGLAVHLVHVNQRRPGDRAAHRDPWLVEVESLEIDSGLYSEVVELLKACRMFLGSVTT